MRLGVFLGSLAVKDLAASRDCYAKLEFEPLGGDGEGFVASGSMLTSSLWS